MNERNVGRIDEPDDGIIDIGWEPNRLDVMQPLVRRNEQIGKNILRNLGLMLVTWHVDPNRAAYLFAGIGVGLDFPDIEGAIRKGGDLLAGTGAVELPTVIATLDGSSVELTLRERHSSMWTVVPQRERISARISSQGDLFAEQFFGLKLAPFQFVAMEREVPEVSQKQGVLHIAGSRELFDDAPYLIVPRSGLTRSLGFRSWRCALDGYRHPFIQIVNRVLYHSVLSFESTENLCLGTKVAAQFY